MGGDNQVRSGRMSGVGARASRPAAPSWPRECSIVDAAPAKRPRASSTPRSFFCRAVETSTRPPSVRTGARAGRPRAGPGPLRRARRGCFPYGGKPPEFRFPRRWCGGAIFREAVAPVTAVRRGTGVFPLSEGGCVVSACRDLGDGGGGGGGILCYSQSI